MHTDGKFLTATNQEPLKQINYIHPDVGWRIIKYWSFIKDSFAEHVKMMRNELGVNSIRLPLVEADVGYPRLTAADMHRVDEMLFYCMDNDISVQLIVLPWWKNPFSNKEQQYKHVENITAYLNRRFKTGTVDIDINEVDHNLVKYIERHGTIISTPALLKMRDWIENIQEHTEVSVLLNYWGHYINGKALRTPEQITDITKGYFPYDTPCIYLHQYCVAKIDHDVLERCLTIIRENYEQIAVSIGEVGVSSYFNYGSHKSLWDGIYYIAEKYDAYVVPWMAFDLNESARCITGEDRGQVFGDREWYIESQYGIMTPEGKPKPGYKQFKRYCPPKKAVDPTRRSVWPEELLTKLITPSKTGGVVP